MFVFIIVSWSFHEPTKKSSKLIYKFMQMWMQNTLDCNQLISWSAEPVSSIPCHKARSILRELNWRAWKQKIELHVQNSTCSVEDMVFAPIFSCMSWKMFLPKSWTAWNSVIRYSDKSAASESCNIKFYMKSTGQSMQVFTT